MRLDLFQIYQPSRQYLGTLLVFILFGVNFTDVSFLIVSVSYFIIRTKQESMVLADMQLKPGEAWGYCPRETLRRVAKVLKDEFDLVRNLHIAILRKLLFAFWLLKLKSSLAFR